MTHHPTEEQQVVKDQEYFDLFTCKAEDALDELRKLGRELCTMCGAIHPFSFFPNRFCQNCNDEAGMTKEDLDELNRLAETSPYRSKKDQ